MNRIFLVGAGGAIGSVLRYWFSGVVQQWTQSAGFPFGTLAVNFAGCFVIGFLSQLANSRGVFTDKTHGTRFCRRTRRLHNIFNIQQRHDELNPRRRKSLRTFEYRCSHRVRIRRCLAWTHRCLLDLEVA